MRFNIEELKNFFFEASLATYAGDAPKGTIIELPKSKVLRYEKGKFLYVDHYYSSRAGKSFGQTTIWCENVPVWGMQYWGKWNTNDSRIIPFLKKALRAAYEKGVFIGGRGPEVFVESPLYYFNNILKNEGVLTFKGFELINAPINAEIKTIFRHEYHGMLLF